MKLGYDFYQLEDTELLAKKLLGKYLVTHINDQYTAGIIVETEAYCGNNDRASHAYNGRRTKRTEIMYREGGTAYVYLIYGIYSLFNVVTSKKDVPHAVLIRAVEPVDGIEIMLKRRNLKDPKRNLTAGPGLLTQALGISTRHSGVSLLKDEIWLEERQFSVNKKEIVESPRVGVAYALEDAVLKRRYRIRNNPWLSSAK